MQGLHSLLCFWIKHGSLLAQISLLCSLASLPLTNIAASEAYTSYIGGNLYDNAYDSVLDGQGNLYITGQTFSSSFTNISTTVNSSSLDQNCFITKYNISNPDTSFTLIFGGNKKEVCRKIRLDSQQNVYIIGETQSNDFFVTNSSYLRGNWDGFVIKFNANLEITGSSYIGGSNTDFAHGLALIDDRQLAIVGETWSKDFPTTANAYIQDCDLLDICDEKTANAYLLILDTQFIDSHSPVYSTYLGGSGNDKAHTVISNNTQIILAGETQSHDFPLINQIMNTPKGNLDAFISIINFSNPLSPRLTFSTYLGGNSNDSAADIKFDQDQNIIIIGETSSDDFPVTENAFSKRCADGNTFCITSNSMHSDIFIAKINQNLTLEYATLFGGSDNDLPTSIIVDEQNSWWISGKTQSNDLPVTNNAKHQNCISTKRCNANSDGFLMHIKPELIAKESLGYASYFGGNAADVLLSLYIKQNKIIVIGNTDSVNLAGIDSLNNLQQNGDAFVSYITLPADGIYLPQKKMNNSTPPHPQNASLNHSFLLGFFILLALSRRLYKLNFVRSIKMANNSHIFFK